MSGFPLSNLTSVAPMLIVILFAMIVLMVDLVLPKDRKSPLVGISIIGLLFAAGVAAYLWGKGVTGFGGTVVADDFSLMFQLILIVVAALSILLSERYIQEKGINFGEYYALLLFSTSGAMLMATSQELITIFVGLEVLSIALYILSGFARTEPRSEESAMKYFLLGSFSSAFFLYGIALIYGGTGVMNAAYAPDGVPAALAAYQHVGTTRLDLLVNTQVTNPDAFSSPIVIAGFAMLLIGLGFKAALVPFHSWTPDVYEGAPTSVTAFMSAGAKAGAFAVLVRVAASFLQVNEYFETALVVLAVLTMFVGNAVAVLQTNIKRMLAYSSIAHAGYILVGLLAQNEEGHAGILFYVLAYTFMNLGAFGILILLSRRGDEIVRIEDLRGLAKKNPGIAALMALFMLSLGGIPPTAGFMGKVFLFLGAVHANLIGLAVFGVLASVIGAFYYLRVIWSMFFDEPSREYPANWRSFSPLATVAVAICAIATLVFGIMPSGLYDATVVGAKSLPQTQSAVAPQPAAAPVAALPVTGTTPTP